MRYRMILFDFFNTLVVPDSSRIPTLQVDGKPVTSTAGLLHRRLVEEKPGLAVGEVQRAMEAATRTARKKRGPELREPPARERFRDVAAELGIGPENENLCEELLACHMEAVIGSFALPEPHLCLLERLRPAYRLAIFSNFDHAPAVLRLMRRLGIDSWFEPVVISETIGYRKPGPAAFQQALALAGEPRERILFVGDSLKDDVEGANLANLDVAWVNRNGEEPSAEARPTYTLDTLTGLEPLLAGLPHHE
jgi:FMN phosphatase YigB (HAD superfamily)